jgi:hypothetical protein
MIAARFFFARLVLRRFGPFAAARRVAIGLIALVLMAGTELALTLLVQGLTLAQYVATRDPVSGTAYLLSLAVFALMPLLVGNRQGSNKSFKPNPLRGSA